MAERGSYPGRERDA